jgi:hypothetical protein
MVVSLYLPCQPDRLMLTTPSPLSAWQIIVHISLIPAFGTLYHHLTLPEAHCYLKAKKLTEGIDEVQLAQLREEETVSGLQSQISSQIEHMLACFLYLTQVTNCISKLRISRVQQIYLLRRSIFSGITFLL